MKMRSIFVAVAALMLAAGAMAIAQQDERGNGRMGGKPAAGGQNYRPAQQSYGGAYHGGVQANGPTNGGVHHSGVPQHIGQVRAGFQQSQAQSWKVEHRGWADRGGYTGYRIPDARFRMYFGHDHFFRIGGLPLVFVGGYPRFQYDGFWFTFMDTWPETWGPNWWQTDDVYVDSADGGYYLINPRYPGVRIALTATF